MQQHRNFEMTAIGLGALWLAACSATPPVTVTPSSATTAKIAPVLMQAAQQLQGGERLPANGPVRSDAQGRIQVYVHVTDTGAATVTALAAHGLQDTVVSPQLHVVQGWVDPSDLESLAALPFVTYLSPPVYAKRR